MSFNHHNGKRRKYFLSESCFPQNIDVIKTKCHGLDMELEIGDIKKFDWSKAEEYCGMLV
jgi:glycine cleavage system pyridoxal-binding protein P